MLEDRILFIDDDAIVIDKPAGLPVDTPRRGGDSVVSLAHELRLGKRSSPVPMHRLDQDTSGCLVLARNATARAKMQMSFETGNTQKIYLGVVDAEIAEEGGRITVPLAKKSSKEKGWWVAAYPDGQPATTKWRRMEVRDGRTLIRFEPLTGRTHQIRAHALEAFGAGIVGDPVYGKGGEPMLLHALRLSLAHKDSPYWTIDAVAPLPEHWADWEIDQEAVERDKERIAALLTYRNWSHDYWKVLLENVDGPLFAGIDREARPLIAIADDVLEDLYYRKNAIEPMTARFSTYHHTILEPFQRFLPILATAGRPDLMEKLWSSVTRRARSKYFSDRRDLRKDYALRAYSEAVEWLTRVGSHDLAKEMAQAADHLREGRFPELPAVSDLRKMDEQVFWELLSRSRSHAETTEEQVAVLDELLRNFRGPDIRKFASIYARYMKQLYHWNAWALAYAARGGCSDDAFMEFRTWLILQGDPDLVELAVKDPTKAAERVPEDPDLPEGTLLPTIDEAHLARAKSTFEWPTIGLEKPKGREWPEDQLETRFPDLVRHYEA